jgi:hypothetical protein
MHFSIQLSSILKKTGELLDSTENRENSILAKVWHPASSSFCGTGVQNSLKNFIFFHITSTKILTFVCTSYRAHTGLVLKLIKCFFKDK